MTTSTTPNMSAEMEARILAYLDGELSSAEQQSLQKELDADPFLRAEFEGLQAVHELVRQENRIFVANEEPPAHLFDAILRAEALSRPPELQKAVAAYQDKQQAQQQAQQHTQQDHKQSPSLWNKMRLWLAGGGLALSAGAAAIGLMVADKADHATAVQEKAAPMAAAPTAPLASTAARAEAPQDVQNLGEGDGLAAGAGADDLALGGGDDDGLPQRKESKNKVESPTKPTATATPLPDAAPAGKNDQNMAAGIAAEESAKEMEDEAQYAAKSKSRFEASGQDAARIAAPSPVVLPKPVADDSNSARAGAAADADNNDAPTAAPKANMGATAGPPPPTPALQQFLAQERAKKAAKADSKAALAEGAASEKTDGKGDKNAKRQEFLREAKKIERSQSMDIDLQAGVQALESGYPDEAYEIFTRAHARYRADIGAMALVGQMRSLKALQKYDAALAVINRVDELPKSAAGVGDAYYLGGQIAESIGDIEKATALYQKASATPAFANDAKGAIQRLKASKNNRSKSK